MSKPQTIPARHGTATYVPKGQTIKIINTTGTQVFDTWAFALHKAPQQDEKKEEGTQKKDEKSAKKEEPKKEEPKKDAKKEQASKEGSKKDAPKKDEKQVDAAAEDEEADYEKNKLSPDDPNYPVADAKLPVPQPEGKEPAKSAGWSSYIPSFSSSSKAQGTPEKKTPKKLDRGSKSNTPKKDEKKEGEEQKSAGWSAYMPTVYGSSTKGQEKNEDGEATGKKRTWGDWMPTGQGFSSYIPEGTSGAISEQVSAFSSAHHRDPNKSYAEQFYDFSKTPVGAAGLSVATGSGIGGSLYAAYSAYNQSDAMKQPPMEYLSTPHSLAQGKHIKPKVNDTLYSNLRNPILSIVEDTSDGNHEMLMAACDPAAYRELGVEKWQEHGSCAENLVLALKQMNQSAGLKGIRSVGADITVNIAPVPLKLFLNAPFDDEGNVEYEEHNGKAGEYVKLRAERDVVIVMSACPMDILPINGEKPTDGQFVVEEEKTKPKPKQQNFGNAEKSLEALRKKRAAGQGQGNNAQTKKPAPSAAPKKPAQPAQQKSEGGPAPAAKRPSVQASQKPAAQAQKPAAQQAQKSAPAQQANGVKNEAAGERRPSQPVKNQAKEGKPKPKKLTRKTSEKPAS